MLPDLEVRSLLKTRWGYIYHPFTFLKYLSFFKNYFFACECKYVQRPEGMIICSGTGVAEAVTAPCGCYEPTPVLLQEAYVLATMDTSFQHHCFSSLIGLFCCCCCCCTFRAISCVFSWCFLLMNIKQIKIVLFYLLAAQLHRENLWEFKYQPLTLTELFQGQQEAALSNQCSKYARYSAALKTRRNPRT